MLREHSFLRSSFLVTAAIIFTGVIIVLIFPVGLVTPFGKVTRALEKLWAATLVRLAGIRLKIDGLEHIQGGQTYIFVANHQSLFDIPVLMYGLPRQVRMIHKKELLWIPGLGQVLMALRFISIDRGRREKAIQSLKRAARKIHDGVNIVIFADGTRSLDGELRPLKNGAFLLAIDAQVDVVPVTISGTINVLHKMQSLLDITFGREVRVILGKPLSTHGLTADAKDVLRQQVQSTIEEDYASIRRLSEITNPALQKYRHVRQTGVHGAGALEKSA